MLKRVVLTGLKFLELEFLRLLPVEVLVGEMPIPRRLVINRLDQVELLDNDTRPHVEVVADDLYQLVRALVRCAVGLDEEGEGFSYTDGVGELD